MKRQRSRSAEDLLNELKNDREWVSSARSRQLKVDLVRQHLAQDEQPIVKSLAKSGVHVNSVWDLVNRPTTDSRSFAVLAEHLTIGYQPRTREGIARALSVPEARGTDAARTILTELQRRASEGPNDARWALANALTVVADPSMRDAIRHLLADQRYADCHLILRAALSVLC